MSRDMFPILFQNSNFVVIDKPEGFFVHPPESPEMRRFFHPRQAVLSQLRDQLGQYLYPVHRLDVATSGALVFALSSVAARHFCEALQAGEVEKRYELICRGWPALEGQIEIELASDSSDQMLASLTRFRSLGQLSLPSAGSEAYFRHPFPTLRYAWMEAQPITGRFHQIRRHFNRISHPILGDNDHGDSRHNRFFREKLQISGLCLRAHRLRFPDMDGRRLQIEVAPNAKWRNIHSLFSHGHEKVINA